MIIETTQGFHNARLILKKGTRCRDFGNFLEFIKSQNLKEKLFLNNLLNFVLYSSQYLDTILGPL